MILWGLCCLSVSGNAENLDHIKGVGNGTLELHFYGNRCPSAEMIVKAKMRTFMLTDPTTSAALLRLAFHDCQVDVF